jgi:hypothetical protein
MKRLLLLLLIVGCHARKEAALIPVVALHPAGEAKADCHPEKEMAATVTPEKVGKVHLNFPACPDNMRLVLPSRRQMKIAYPKSYSDSGYDSEDELDVEYSHATCIPDGLSK